MGFQDVDWSERWQQIMAAQPGAALRLTLPALPLARFPTRPYQLQWIPEPRHTHSVCSRIQGFQYTGGLLTPLPRCADYNYELQSPMLTRLRQSQSQSSGLSRATSLPSADSVLSRAPVGLMSTPEAYSSQPAAPWSAVQSSQSAVRALTHEPSLQKSTSSSSGPDRQVRTVGPLWSVLRQQSPDLKARSQSAYGTVSGKRLGTQRVKG